MKKSSVSVGGEYVAKISGDMTIVRLDRASEHGGWHATNLKTKKECRIKTAAKLRCAATAAHRAVYLGERMDAPRRVNVPESENLVAAMERSGRSPTELLSHFGIDHDRYNNGGYAELVGLLRDEDPEWVLCELEKLTPGSTSPQITGPVSWKKYRCESCGHESMHNTNHYGEIYDRCENCSWKSPLSPTKVHRCLDPLPEGWGTPEPWKNGVLRIDTR